MSSAPTDLRLPSRRQFTKALAWAGVPAWWAARHAGAQAVVPRDSVPAPGSSGIEHVVVCMMENRSFDHIMGWLPGADGKQAGLTYMDQDGVPQSTYHLTDFRGCSHPDPDHSYIGGRVEYSHGACDGWLRAGSNDLFSIG